MPDHELERVIASADAAINGEDFDALMDFYSDEAILVVRPGQVVAGKGQIRRAMVAIAAHFNHSLKVSQGDMLVLEANDTALVLAKTAVEANQGSGHPYAVERRATYVFKKCPDGKWRCVIDNSYGTELLAALPR